MAVEGYPSRVQTDKGTSEIQRMVIGRKLLDRHKI
jgi:hypothetical protein